MIDVNQYFEKFILPEILENDFTMGVYMEDDEYEDYYSCVKMIFSKKLFGLY